jgi:PAS domain S-box-containing protein
MSPAAAIVLRGLCSALQPADEPARWDLDLVPHPEAAGVLLVVARKAVGDGAVSEKFDAVADARAAAHGPSKDEDALRAAATGRDTFREETPFRLAGTVRDVTASRAAEAAAKQSEARLKAALRGARLGVWERHLPSSTGTWDARASEIYGGLTPERCSPDLAEWRTRVHPEDRDARLAAIAAAIAPGGIDSYSVEFRFRRDDGGWNFIAVHGTVVQRDPMTGEGVRLVGVAEDLTERQMAEEALRASEATLRLAQDAGGVGSWEWDVRTGALFWSESCHRLHGTDPAAPANYAAWREGIHAEDQPRVEAAMRAALEGCGDAWEEEFRFVRPANGETRWVVGRGRVVRDPVTGESLRMVGVTLDVTERRRAEERLRLLAREVDHWAKNALAVVQAAVRLAPKGDAAAFAAAVEGRVAALARAQVLLADTGWQGAPLRAVAEGALAAFQPAEGDEGGGSPKVALTGLGVRLAAAAVQPIALALHELATNAAKYGALSRAGGHVALSWDADEAAGLLRLSWAEAGGPALEAPPALRGFGSRVIEATLGGQLGGTVKRHWERGGLCCEVSFPLARAVAADAGAPAGTGLA